MHGFESLASAIAHHGVKIMFGLIGDGNLFMTDEFVRHHGGRFISVAHESAAILAANGYARVSGDIGVATITHGPALTNTITPLVESVRDRTPMLVIAGDTAVEDRGNLQNIDQRLFVEPTGAGFEQLRSPETLFEDVARSIARSLAELRPIVLNVPIDFMWMNVVPTVPKQLPASFPGLSEVIPDSESLEEAAATLVTADRPVILAGRGAISPSAKESLTQLALTIGAPLCTTLRARNFFEGEAHNLGILGTLSSDITTEVILNADVLVSFGASLNSYTTGEGAFLLNKRIIQVDIDATALNKYQAVDVPIWGDSTSVARELNLLVREVDVRPSRFASPELAKRLTEFSPESHVIEQENYVDMGESLRTLNRLYPADRTLVVDGGRFLDNTFKYVHVKHPKDYIHTLSFGAIGLGMGNAIGAACASHKPTLLIIGDGGFMLGGLTEFNTAVRHNLDLTVVLLNDGAYGAEHIQFREKDMDPSIATFNWPSFEQVAFALGGNGFTVRSIADMEHALSQRVSGVPTVLDVQIDPDLVI